VIEQAVRLGADLVGGAVVELQGAGTAPDIDAQGQPGEGGLKDALPQVTGEEEPVGTLGAQGGQKPQLGHADILGLVHQHKLIGRRLPARQDPGQAGEEGGAGDQARVRQAAPD
jgi:hypothetical protein